MQETEKWLRVYSATLDTNIFIRSMIRMDNLSNKLISLWLEKKFILVLPQATIDELQNVLSRRALIRKHRYPSRRVGDLIDKLKGEAEIVNIRLPLGLCRDAKDNPLVDCAIQEKVQFLVSYDKDLLDDPELRQNLFEYGVEIVDPLTFLEKLRDAEINIYESDISID